MSSAGFTQAYQDAEGSQVHDKRSGLKVDVVDAATKLEKSKGFMDKEVESAMDIITRFLGEYCAEDTPRILDVGCCIGRELRCLESVLEKSAVFYGVDIMKAVLDQAKQLGPKDCSYIEGDIHALPFEENYFDVVYCKRVLIHSDVEKAMQEMVRVLKPGGLALFIEGDVSAFHLHTTDPRMVLVESQKQISTLNSIKNPNVVSLTRSIVEKMDSVENIDIEGFASVISDISVMHQFSNPVVKKLIDDNVVSQEDGDYYLAGLQNPETVGYPLYSAVMFFISCRKK